MHFRVKAQQTSQWSSYKWEEEEDEDEQGRKSRNLNDHWHMTRQPNNKMHHLRFKRNTIPQRTIYFTQRRDVESWSAVGQRLLYDTVCTEAGQCSCKIHRLSQVILHDSNWKNNRTQWEEINGRNFSFNVVKSTNIIYCFTSSKSKLFFLLWRFLCLFSCSDLIQSDIRMG